MLPRDGVMEGSEDRVNRLGDVSGRVRFSQDRELSRFENLHPGFWNPTRAAIEVVNDVLASVRG